MGKFQRLLKEVQKYAHVSIIAHPFDNLNGCYHPVNKIIHIKKTLSNNHKLYILAHEFGHAFYDHTTCDVDQAIRDEREANTFSIKLAKQYNFYTPTFKAYVNKQRRTIRTKWYRRYLIDIGYNEHLKK